MTLGEHHHNPRDNLVVAVPADAPPTESFKGGIRSRGSGVGVSWPFGHLDFDAEEIHVWGGGMDLRRNRDQVQAVRLAMGILATRVIVVGSDGEEGAYYFAALGRGPLRRALLRRGWPVLERGRLIEPDGAQHG